MKPTSIAKLRNTECKVHAFDLNNKRMGFFDLTGEWDSFFIEDTDGEVQSTFIDEEGFNTILIKDGKVFLAHSIDFDFDFIKGE